MNKGNRYRKTKHCEKEGWLIEAPFICMPPGVKHWTKKYLSRRDRYERKQKLKGEQNNE